VQFTRSAPVLDLRSYAKWETRSAFASRNTYQGMFIYSRALSSKYLSIMGPHPHILPRPLSFCGSPSTGEPNFRTNFRTKICSNALVPNMSLSLGMNRYTFIIYAGYQQKSSQGDHKSHIYHYVTFLSLESTQVPLSPARESRCNKKTIHHHLVNKLFENFLLLSVSPVLCDNGLSERGGKMDKRSQ
jgi:hypothetical protein